MKNIIKYFREFWRSGVVIAAPVLLSPIAFVSGTTEAKCGYVMLVMAVLWATEAVPIAVTALVPVFAFPLLGVLNTEDVSYTYMKETNMMFLGGLMVAVSVEHSNLHRRIALNITMAIGLSPKKIAAGFMISTMFLSMWISNTASTVIMVPIVEAFLQEIYRSKCFTDDKSHADSNGESVNTSAIAVELVESVAEESQWSNNERKEEKGSAQIEDSNESIPAPNKTCELIRNYLYLATAYGANLGGTGSYTGTGPNLVLKGVLKSEFAEETELTFASWLVYNVPGMLICAVLVFLWLSFLLIGFKKSSLTTSNTEREQALKNIILKKLEEIGPMSFHEKTVLFFFSLLVFLWFFLSPGFIDGWGAYFLEKYGISGEIGDATPAMLIAFILFAFPARPNFLFFKDEKASKFPSSSPSCLTWKIAQEKVPWGIVLLLGSGFAMAEAARKSGLSEWLGDQLQFFDFMPSGLVMFCTAFMTAMTTELCSNTAVASIFLPILSNLALSLCINPLLLVLPATLCCSYAFMLPVATPPNAIVYGASQMESKVMIKAGFVANLICIAVSSIMISTYGILIFDIHNLPSWINSTEIAPLNC